MQVKNGFVWFKQAPSAWYDKIHAYLVAYGFQNSPTKSTLYVKHEGDVFLIIVLYVDDMLLAGPNEVHIVDFKVNLNAFFEMSYLGLFHHYLGIQFKQCDGGISLCQAQYM